MMPILPPGWTWLDNGSATNGVDVFRYGTLNESAGQAWKRWEKVSGVTKERWDALNVLAPMGLSTLVEKVMRVLDQLPQFIENVAAMPCECDNGGVCPPCQAGKLIEEVGK